MYFHAHNTNTSTPPRPLIVSDSSGQTDKSTWPFVDIHRTKKSEQPVLDSARIWNAFQNGSSEAFRLIYNINVDVLYAYGKKFTDENDVVKDCIHDLFVDLWNSRGKLSSVTNVSAYLCVSLRRRITSLQKRQKTLQSISAVEDCEMLVGYNPDDAEEPDKVTAALSRELSKLSERQREVTFLRYYAGLSCTEIADIMGIHAQSVYNLIQRSIKALRSSMKSR